MRLQIRCSLPSLTAASFAAAVALDVLLPAAALATPCPSAPTCTAGGVTFNLTDPGDGNGAIETDNQLIFLATFDPSNENPSTITAAVDAFLTAEGLPGGQYFGRTGGSGAGAGGSVPGASFSTTSANGGLNGTFTFNPGSTGLTAGYISLHAGGGQHDVLLEIPASEGVGGPFNWDTSENINGGGNSAAISNFDLFSGGPLPVPEPASLVLFGTSLIALGFIGGRRQKRL